MNYKGKSVGFYIPDFIVEKKIIVEIKALEHMPKSFEIQLFNYLKGTEFQLGYMVNFGSDAIDIRRRIYESARDKLA